MFPLIYPSTRLRLVAGFMAVLWVAATLSATPFSSANIAAASAAGVALAWLWYRLLDGPVPLAELFDADAPRARRLGWVALIVTTGIVAFYLHGRIAPLLPVGEWHWLLSRLFVALAWSALLWPLPSLGTRVLFRGHLIGAAR